MTDPGRLTELVTARAGALALYARQWVDAATADDVVQEMVIALLSQRAMPNDPVAWMYRTVRNGAIDQARSISSRRRREQKVAQTRQEWFETRADAKLDAKIAEAALRKLPAALREIVVLRIWGQLGFAQIAQVTGYSLSTVHGRYENALRQMREELEKSLDRRSS
ncbi:MAG: sigma-70 family RNA polymerase sigma factor [Tepidisphaeraceae bacterium]